MLDRLGQPWAREWLDEDVLEPTADAPGPSAGEEGLSARTAAFEPVCRLRKTLYVRLELRKESGRLSSVFLMPRQDCNYGSEYIGSSGAGTHRVLPPWSLEDSAVRSRRRLQRVNLSHRAGVSCQGPRVDTD